MTTLEHKAPEKITDYWTAALKFLATGRTAEGLRAHAADPGAVKFMALLSGITPEEEREQVLAVASAIDNLTAAGMTPEKAYNLAGLEDLLGCPFREFDPDCIPAAA